TSGLRAEVPWGVAPLWTGDSLIRHPSIMPRRRFARPLSIEETALGCHMALRNARELLDDAQLLLAHKRFARSYALAHLAAEELSKVPMLYRIGLQMHAGLDVNWKQLEVRFLNHATKTRANAVLDYFFDPNMAE